MLSREQANTKVAEMKEVEIEVAAEEKEAEEVTGARVAEEIDVVVIIVVVKGDNYFEAKNIGNNVTA
jgi:hypothetical protein